MVKTLAEEMETPNQREKREKLSYVKTQINEMEAIIRRNEVDIYINENTEWTDDEQVEVDAKTREYTKLNTRLSKAIVALKKLQSELDK